MNFNSAAEVKAYFQGARDAIEALLPEVDALDREHKQDALRDLDYRERRDLRGCAKEVRA